MPTYTLCPAKVAWRYGGLKPTPNAMAQSYATPGRAIVSRPSVVSRAWSTANVGKVTLVQVGPRVPAPPTLGDKLTALAEKFGR
jgi:hypothetical protein